MKEQIAQNKFFTAYKAAEGVTRIVGMAMECCYLVEGKNGALLIDGLTGVGTLMPFVRELTDKPVTVAITHGHMDHTGAAWECGRVYIHPDDISLLYANGDNHRKVCMDFVNLYLKLGLPTRTRPTMADVHGICPVITLPVCDGDTIDLGGTVLEVIHVPGHTWGSVVYLDRARRILFSGDACNSNTLLNLPCSTSIAGYKAALEHLNSHRKDFDILLTGHDQEPIPARIVGDGIRLCSRILDRTDDAVETEDAFGGKSLLAGRRAQGFALADGSLCNIVYKPETIYTKEKPGLSCT